MGLRSSLFVAQWRLHDLLRYRSRWPTGVLIAAWAATPFARWKRWHYLLAAHRFSYSPFTERRILRDIDSVVVYSHRALAPGSGIDGSSESTFY